MKLSHLGLLMNRLKWFSWKIRFRWDIREISDSWQANTARSFSGINFVFAGLLKENKMQTKYMWTIAAKLNSFC